MAPRSASCPARAGAARARVPAGAEKAAVLARHRTEWERHGALMDEVLDGGDPERAKLAKLVAETLKIRQEAERRAWGIQDKAEAEVGGAVAVTWQS